MSKNSKGWVWSGEYKGNKRLCYVKEKGTRRVYKRSDSLYRGKSSLGWWWYDAMFNEERGGAKEVSLEIPLDYLV